MFLAFCFLFFFGFFGYNTKTTSNKSKNPHGSYIILKNIYTIKGKKNDNKVKRHPTEWEKILSNHLSDAVLIQLHSK